MNTTTNAAAAAAPSLVGATVRIGRREFTITEQVATDRGPEAVRGMTQYILTGKRGATYGTMRNVHRPERMFLIDLRGFGMATGFERTWLVERNGTLEVL